MEINHLLDSASVIILAVVCGSGLIQIAPIKINPWSWMLRKIGQVANEDLIDKIDKLDKKVDEIDERVKAHESQREEKENIERRRRILRFADECRKNEKHSLEHFNEILDDVSKYKTYCEEHPKFKNDKCAISIEFVEKAYRHCVETNDFL